MELPKYHETFIPVLEILNSVESINSRELALQVRDRYYSNLSFELMNQKTSSGGNVLIDRILWGKPYLKWKNTKTPFRIWIFYFYIQLTIRIINSTVKKVVYFF